MSGIFMAYHVFGCSLEMLLGFRQLYQSLFKLTW